MLGKRVFSLLLFIDFRKAFDLVDSEKLLRKLIWFRQLGNRNVQKLFKDSHQSVKYDKKLSPLMDILLGVLKGSVLGPLFFLLMINDLAFIIEIVCKLFADDATLGDFDNDLDRLLKSFAEKLKVLLEWYYFKKLGINCSKTFYVCDKQRC